MLYTIPEVAKKKTMGKWVGPAFGKPEPEHGTMMPIK
jgi:hypothetical protein